MSKIVLVDDSYSELQMMEGYLKSANYTVLSYPNLSRFSGLSRHQERRAFQDHSYRTRDVKRPGERQILGTAAGSQ